MKVAILIAGHIRTWEECKSNFINSFSHLNPDVIVSTYDLQYNYHPAQRGWMGESPDNILTKNEIVKLFDGVNLKGLDIESIQSVTDEYEKNKNDLHPNFRDEPHSFFQCRKMKQLTKLIEMVETENRYKYDVIIKLRSDIPYSKFEYSLNDNDVIIAGRNVFPNDVIIATKRDNFFNLSNHIYSELHNPITPDSHLNLPHNLFLSGFNQCNLNIRVEDLFNCVVRKTGKHYYN